MGAVLGGWVCQNPQIRRCHTTLEKLQNEGEDTLDTETGKKAEKAVGRRGGDYSTIITAVIAL